MSEEEKRLHAFTGMTIDEYAKKILKEWNDIQNEEIQKEKENNNA
jgi:hypothetical protein